MHRVRKAHARPTLEALEDRSVPTAALGGELPTVAALPAAADGPAGGSALVQAAVPTTTTLTYALDITQLEALYRFTVKVTPNQDGGHNPTGTVSLYQAEGTTVFSVPTLLPVDASGTAFGFSVVTTDPLAFTAIYSGDGDFGSSTSAPLYLPPPAVSLRTVSHESAFPADAVTPNQRLVTQFYHDLLGRDPEPAGLAYWAGLLDQGQSRLQVAWGIESSQECQLRDTGRLFGRILHRLATSDELQAGTGILSHGGTRTQLEALVLSSEEYLQSRGGGTAEGFVRAVYQDVLQRPPGLDELQAWLQRLAGGQSRAAVAGAILGSLEAETERVQGLFQFLLQRPGTGAELTGFVSALQGGASDIQVVAILASSPEYSAGLNGPLFARYVAQVYRDLLAREAGPDDLRYWVAPLEQGLATPAQVVQQIEQSPEYEARHVQTLYATFLHRPAGPAELAAFVPFLSQGGRAEELASLLAGSPEYFQVHGGTGDGFLQGLYQEALGRPANSSETAGFGPLLGQQAGRAKVAAAIFSGEEYRQALVRNEYGQLLHRTVADADLAFAEGLLAAGDRSADLVAVLAGSEEYLSGLSSGPLERLRSYIGH